MSVLPESRRLKYSPTLDPRRVMNCMPSPDQLGDLDRVARIVKLNGYVQCVDGYTGQPTVINGASDLLAEVRYPYY